MKKITIILLALIIPATTWAITRYASVVEINTPSWVIDNRTENPTVVYKIEDGNTNCYVAKSNTGVFKTLAISCVTIEGDYE